MINKKQIIAAIMALAIAVTLMGCSQNEGGDTPTVSTTSTVDDDLENPVDVGDIDLEIDATEDMSGTVLKYMGCYDLRKAGDIKPAYKYLQETYGVDIDVEIVGSLEIPDKLSVYISSGTSPDLVDTQEDSFPCLVLKNMYAPIEDYIDLSLPQWDGCRQYIETFAINGHYYFVPWSYSVGSRFLIYNRGLFEDYGIDDPKELYDNQEWTWDTFKQCILDFVDKSEVENAIGLYGSVAYSFVATTGKSLVGYENGQMVGNLNSPEIERAQLFLEDLRKQKLTAVDFDGGGNIALEPIIDGKAAFQSMGGWIVTNYSVKMKDDENLDIFFVPMPRDPLADKYYYSYSAFGYYVPAGSQNIAAACTFINCVRLSVTDQELAAVTKESIMKNKKYTEEQYEFSDLFNHPEHFADAGLVLEYSYGMDSNLRNDVLMPMFENIALDQSEEQMSWVQMRETYLPLIEQTISDLNGSLATFSA